jgi:AGCS family alanine or glycine:cation symporter
MQRIAGAALDFLVVSAMATIKLSVVMQNWQGLLLLILCGTIFAVAMVFFAFTTLLGNLFYVEKALSHVLGHFPGKTFRYIYYVIASLIIFVGAGLSAGMLWDFADITMGFMTIINIPVILILSKYAVRCLNDYTAQRKAGKDPVFKAKDIGIDAATDYWNEG